MLLILSFGYVYDFGILPPFGVNICSPSPLCIPLALWEKLTFYICIHVFYNSPFRFQKIHAVYCCMKTLT